MSKKKKEESNPSFDKLSESLDSKFDGEDLVEEFQQIEKKKNELVNTNKDSMTLEDVGYMEMEIKNCVEGLEVVMNKLEQDIKIGSAPRLFEVYSTLANSKMNGIKELRELRKIMLDVRIKMEKADNINNKLTINNFNMTSKEINKFIDNAKEKNLLKEVKAEFKIDTNLGNIE